MEFPHLSCSVRVHHLQHIWQTNGTGGHADSLFFWNWISCHSDWLSTESSRVGIGLALIGVFASIYHPVGIAMLIEGGGKVGWLLGMNGVWGNMGVAGAPW
ncbi:MAG: hypothetical protein CM1200mP30_32020 [Pseudomonadota bacterium]|nr:MAG: hypothetical protein CM1200mP30_32020 [Pseudomonadota bacterium]